MLVEMISEIPKKSVTVFAFDAQGSDAYFVNEKAFADWCMRDLELQMIADVKPTLIQTKVSGETALAPALRRLKQEWKKIHGAVFVLPPADFLYHASAIAFGVGDAGKPIVCTTALLPGEYSSRGFFNYVALRATIMNAVQAATVDMAGVMVVGGAELIPATHALMRAHGRLYSADRMHYGHIDFGIRPSIHTKPYGEQQLRPQFAAVVMRIDASRDDVAEALKRRTTSAVGCVLIHARADQRSEVDALLPKALPALVCTETTIFLREKGKWSNVKKLTQDTAAAKFAWILGQRKTNPAYRRITCVAAMQSDVIGETLV